MLKAKENNTLLVGLNIHSTYLVSDPLHYHHTNLTNSGSLLRAHPTVCTVYRCRVEITNDLLVSLS